MKVLLPIFAAALVSAGAELRPEDEARRAELERMAQRAAAASERREPMPPGASQALEPGIGLMAIEGQAFVGHQLRFFDQSEPGVLRATKPAWIALYCTEGRDFTLTGEVWLAGPSSAMLHPGDLPDGFALFLREWDGVQRYQLDSRRILAKRRMVAGRATDRIGTTEFGAAPLGQWLPFSARVSQAGIDYQIGNSSARLDGPLDMDGANKIALAPGSKLRNLRLAFGAELETRPAAAATEPAPQLTLQNGDFEAQPSSERGDETGQFGETMFAPGSSLLPGWSVADGLVGFRKEPRSPNGGNVLELGPRDTPGTIAQTVRTRPGTTYSLSFFAAAGRPGANRQIKVRAGEVAKVLDCPAGRYERLSISFQATNNTTEISIGGLGASGFGPMIDDIKLEEAP